ncbi:pyruvate carboxyltransferase [Desulfitobacterium hafniense DCB-2]|uniref:Pyruvate carboxyltransferase n=1 Tax=Desulfitobacterium hafniense (strain DSM 10664 / DCB-2) TaxID=272564 RepID=B8FZP5_DESHD|nr:pyruvate carboxyltransferase [Desulfitobacterium hafniense]ACL19119.1 pyruvate carboxyltransferase [Desulfitobacterium hafniense DCB-2]
MKDSVWLCDTTLRDGEQTPGIAFRFKEKARIATCLAEAGIDEIEVGVPSVGADEMEIIKGLVDLRLPVRLATWNRTSKEDLEASFRTGVGAVSICIPVSDQHIERKLRKSRTWAMDSMGEAVELAKKEGKYVCVGFEDASRADVDFMIKMAKVAEGLRADRIRLADTLGILDPLELARRFAPLPQRTALPLEFHAHNDLGMATANALTALRIGFKAVSVTVGGLGERAGNAPLEEISVAIHHILQRPTAFDIQKVNDISLLVSDITQREVPRSKPVVGSDVFTHTSAVHLDGIRKDVENYQPFPPESISRKHSMVFGKYSGIKELVRLLEEERVPYTQEQLTELLIRVRLHSSIKKIPLQAEDVLSLARSLNQLRNA